MFGLSRLGEGVYAQSGSFQSGSSRSRNGVHGDTDSEFDSAVWGENAGAALG